MKIKLMVSLRILLSALLIAGPAPLVLAKELTAGPIVVVPFTHKTNTVTETTIIDRKIINQDRTNRDDEIIIRQLIQENDMLTQALCERHHTVQQLRRELYGVGIDPDKPSGCDPGSWLLTVNKTLGEYRDQINARDRQKIAEVQTVQPEKINPQDVLDLIRDVEALKAQSAPHEGSDADEQAEVSTGPIIVMPNSDATDPLKQVEDNLQSRLNALEEKVRTIEQKGSNLQTLKVETAAINTQLRQATHKYDQIIVEYSETIKRLKSQWAAERDRQKAMATLKAEQSTSDLKMISQLSEQNNRLMAELAELRTQQTTGENLSQSVLEKDSKIQELNASLEKTNAEFFRLQNIWAEKDKLLRDIKAQLTTSDVRLVQIDGIITSKDREIADLKTKLADTKDQLLRTQRELAQTKEDLDQSKEDLRIAQGKFDNSQRELEEAKEELATVRADMQKSTALLDQSRDEVRASQEELDGLKEQFDRLSENLKQQEAEAAERIAAEHDRLRQDINQVKGAIEDHGQTLAKDEVVVKKVAQEVEDLQGRLNEQIDLARGKDLVIQKLRSEVTALNKQIDENESLDDETRAKVQNVKLQIRAVRRDLAAKAKTIANFEQTISSIITQLQSEAKSQAAQAQQLKSQNDRLRKAQQASFEQQDQINQLMEKIRGYEAEKDSFVEASRKLEARITSLSDEAKDAAKTKDELHALKQSEQERVAEQARLMTMLEVYQKKLNETNANYEAKLKELIEARKAQADLENQVSKLTFESASKDEINQKTKEYFTELERRYTAKDGELKAKDLSISMLEDLIKKNKADYAAQLQPLQDESARQQKEITALNEQLAAANSSLQTATVSAAENEKLKAQLQKAKDQLQAITTDFDFKKKEIIRLKERSLAREKELTALLEEASKGHKKEIAALLEKLKVAEKRVREIENSDKVNQLKRSLSDSNEQIKALKGELKQKQAIINRLKEDASTDSDDIDLMSLHSQLKAMQEKLQESVTRLESQQKTIDSLKAENKALRAFKDPK